MVPSRSGLLEPEEGDRANDPTDGAMAQDVWKEPSGHSRVTLGWR